MKEGNTFKAALGQALKTLASHERFSSEIRELLRKKGADDEVIEQVVTHLQSKNILNDRRCASLAIERLTNGKPIGHERIKQKLLARGAPADLVEELLPKEETDLLALLNKKFPGGATPEKAARFLNSRGFDQEEIRSAIEGFSSE